jgi:hypothetical protein
VGEVKTNAGSSTTQDYKYSTWTPLSVTGLHADGHIDFRESPPPSNHETGLEMIATPDSADNSCLIKGSLFLPGGSPVALTGSINAQGVIDLNSDASSQTQFTFNGNAAS